jgi:uncharacterized protein YhaN
MRFSELHLIRYGQFDGCQLNFPAIRSDLHVIYGPNEAGKSTTMSAIADLLFGFPHAAAYDFQFDKLLLRVGAVIEASGAPVTYRRKRGNVRTLLDGAEQPVDEGPLAALLNGQTRDSFLRAFSLDHTRLREGGRAILEAKDDVGQAIFAAGSGLVGVTRLVAALDEEARAIWTDRASITRSYYVAQKAYDEARARLRESQMRSAHWTELKKSLDGHERELDRLKAQRETLQAALQTTERRRRVLAPIARRGHLQNQFDRLGTIPVLPPNAAAILESALQALSQSEAAARLATQQATAARDQLAELTFDPAILGRRTQVTQLRAQQGAVEKAIRDTPALRAKAAGGADQLRRLLEEVGWPDAPVRDVQARLPGRPRVSELRALLEEHRALEATRDSAGEAMRDQERIGTELGRQLQSLPVATADAAFSAVLQDIRAQGDMEAAARAAQARHDKARWALTGGLAGLSPWRGTAQELAILALPSDVETYPLAEILAGAEEDLTAAAAEVTRLGEERERRALRRAQLLRDEHAVSADMLQDARAVRNAIWSALSAHLAGEAELAAPQETQRRFWGDVQIADDLADRRFDAARHSAAVVGLDQDLQQLDLALAHATSRLEVARSTLAAARAAWTATTRIVAEAISPEGLKAWRTDRLRVLELAEVERSEAAEAARLGQALHDAGAQLAGVLPGSVAGAPPGAPLAALLRAAGAFEREAQQARDQRTAFEVRLKAAEEAQARAKARYDDANLRLAAWQTRWAAAAAEAGLGTQGSLALVRARLDLMDDIRGLTDGIAGYEQRTHDIALDVRAFEAAVEALATDFALPAATLDAASLLAALEAKLEAVATFAERAEGLRERLQDAETREAQACESMTLARGALAPLLAAANVAEPAELSAVLQRAQTAQDLTTQIDELAGSILDSGDGLSLEALLTEAEGGQAAELAGHAEGLQDQLRTLSTEIERVAELRQAAHLQFKAADDRPDAAIAFADMSQTRAEMEAQAETYVRKRAEAALLRWAVERYRREKQAPLLKRASTIFSELTLGRYSGLNVNVEEGAPRLSGIRAEGPTVVPVEGMSEGTVDQLFLALRLAAVEESVADGVRLPFLADDLFVNYDDARSAAGLRVLARLAEQTQVLFFTHHEHLAELARETLQPTNVSICRLGERKMQAA